MNSQRLFFSRNLELNVGIILLYKAFWHINIIVLIHTRLFQGQSRSSTIETLITEDFKSLLKSIFVSNLVRSCNRILKYQIQRYFIDNLVFIFLKSSLSMYWVFESLKIVWIAKDIKSIFLLYFTILKLDTFMWKT